MQNTFIGLIASQFQATLRMMQSAIDACPDDLWDSPVANNPFCQSVFHALFYTDYYLCHSPDTLRQEAFHRENDAAFRDYEELQGRVPGFKYEREFVIRYLAHIRSKLELVLSEETDASLSVRCQFPRREFSRAELYVYYLRHLAHHAGQLSLRLRQVTGKGVSWAGSGW